MAITWSLQGLSAVKVVCTSRDDLCINLEWNLQTLGQLLVEEAVEQGKLFLYFVPHE